MIKNFNINKNSIQSGRSMIEMLGVLAIVGVLSVGGIAGYSKAMEKFKINKTVDHVSQIATNIRTLYAQQTTYAGLNNTTAVQMGVVPDSLATSGTSYTSITNDFGGSVSIWDYYSLEGTFAIAMSKISKQACIEMATLDWGNASSSGLVAMNIGWITNSTIDDSTCNKMIGSDWFTYCPHKGPLTVAQATQACNNGGEDNESYGILWIFK